MRTLLALILSVILLNTSIANQKLKVVIDTDMGFDDWMAILYTLKNPNVDVLAITVDCSGESHCPQGAQNATRLLEIAERSHSVPIYSATPIKNQWPTFPEVIRQFATNMPVMDYNDQKKPFLKNVKGYKYSAIPADEALSDILVKQGKKNEPVIILSIGSALNIHNAYRLAMTSNVQEFFKKGLKMLYKGGGSFGESLKVKGQGKIITNLNIEGDLYIPGIYETNNSQAGWNVFVGATEMNELIQAGLPITFIPTNVSNRADITRGSYLQLLKYQHTNKVVDFVLSDVETNVMSQGGWDYAELDYWDPSVVVSALNTDKVVTEKYENVLACVNSNATNHWVAGEVLSKEGTTNFQQFEAFKGLYYYAAILVNEPYNLGNNHPENGNANQNACDLLGVKAMPVNVFMNMNPEAFYKIFFDTLAQNSN